MSQSYASLKKLVLKIKLSPGDSSFTADRDIGVTKGRILFKSSTGATTELISFSGVAASGSNYVYSSLTRDLSETTDPATSTSTGETWKAGSTGYLVAMHDQLFDRQNPRPTTFATTTARDTALGADGAATEAYVNIYVTATGLHYNYNLSTNQWETIETGTSTPNASATVAGKVEISTSAQSIAGTDTGETGALLSVLPSDIAKNTQSGTFVYGADAGGDDTYVVALTPVLAAYTTGQRLTFTPTTANTGACSVDFGPSVLNIKTKDGNDPQSGVIRAGKPVTGTYDGTNFILDSEDFATTANKGIVEMATDAEATTGTDETRYINAKQAKDNYLPLRYVNGFLKDHSELSTTQTITHSLGKAIKEIRIESIQYDGTGIGRSTGVYTTGNNCAYRLSGSGEGGNSTSFSVIVGSTSTVNNTGVIQNLTTNSFDIAWTKNGSPTGNSSILITVVA